MGDVHGIGLHHLARDDGRAEQEHVGGVEQRLGAAHVGARTREHVADMADMIHHQAVPDDGALNRECGIVDRVRDAEKTVRDAVHEDCDALLKQISQGEELGREGRETLIGTVRSALETFSSDSASGEDNGNGNT